MRRPSTCRASPQWRSTAPARPLCVDRDWQPSTAAAKRRRPPHATRSSDRQTSAPAAVSGADCGSVEAHACEQESRRDPCLIPHDPDRFDRAPARCSPGAPRPDLACRQRHASGCERRGRPGSLVRLHLLLMPISGARHFSLVARNLPASALSTTGAATLPRRVVLPCWRSAPRRGAPPCLGAPTI